MIDIDRKNIALIFFILLIIAIIAYFIFFNDSEESKEQLIFDFETASSIKPPNLYVPKKNFTIGDYIYIYETFSNVTEKEGSYDIFLTLKVYKDDSILYDDYRNVTDIDWFGISWYFFTNDWQAGRYEVEGYLLDRNSQISDSATTYFNLV